MALLEIRSVLWKAELELEVVLLEKWEILRALASVGVDEVPVGAENAELMDEIVGSD